MGAGGSKVDMGNYALKSYVQNQLDNYIRREALNEALVEYLRRDDVQSQFKTYIESQGSNGTLDQKIASFLYVKKGDLQTYLEKQEFDKEMLNYLKKVDLTEELQKYVLDGNLEKRVADLGFTKQSQITVPENRLDELAGRITALQGPRAALVTAIASQEGIGNEIADKISGDDAVLSKISTKLGTAYKDQLAQSIAVNSTTLPDNVAEYIVTNDTRASILAGKLVTQQQNILVDRIKEKMIIENIEALRGPPGDLGNPQTVELNLRPRTMWCATGDYCEVPTGKKGLVLREDQNIVGFGAENNKIVRIEDHIALKSNKSIDFADEVEAQAHDIPASQIKIHTRSMRNGIKDGTIMAKFDKVADNEVNAKNSSLDIYGIAKSYGGNRYPRQVKVYDNLEASGTIKAEKLEIGPWKFIPKDGHLYISKTDNTADWKFAMTDDGTLWSSKGISIDKTADWRLSSNGGDNDLRVHKGPNYNDWHASVEKGRVLTGRDGVKSLAGMIAEGDIKTNKNLVSARELILNDNVPGNKWRFHVPDDGRKEMHIARRTDDDKDWNWRDGNHASIYDGRVESKRLIAKENVGVGKWTINGFGFEEELQFSSDNDQKVAFRRDTGRIWSKHKSDRWLS